MLAEEAGFSRQVVYGVRIIFKADFAGMLSGPRSVVSSSRGPAPAVCRWSDHDGDIEAAWPGSISTSDHAPVQGLAALSRRDRSMGAVELFVQKHLCLRVKRRDFAEEQKHGGAALG
ncbi:hypothetical protein AGIG_G20371 [Arapaima gigas]